MKIIYSCYGGAHTSIVASAIHIGLLPLDQIPSKEKMAAIPFYDMTETKDIGRPIFIGLDEHNNEVYVMGMGSYRRESAELVYQIANEVYGGCRGRIFIINTIALINLPIRIGGFLSRRLGLEKMGKKITLYGVKLKYSSFVGLTMNVKRRLLSQS